MDSNILQKYQIFHKRLIPFENVIVKLETEQMLYFVEPNIFS